MYHIGAKELQDWANQASNRLGRGDRAIAESMIDRINYKLKDSDTRRFCLKSPTTKNQHS